MLKQKAFIRHILLFDCTYSTCQTHHNGAQLWTHSGQRFKSWQRSSLTKVTCSLSVCVVFLPQSKHTGHMNRTLCISNLLTGCRSFMVFFFFQHGMYGGSDCLCQPSKRIFILILPALMLSCTKSMSFYAFFHSWSKCTQDSSRTRCYPVV